MQDWRRLGHHVAARRGMLGWTARDLADASECGVRTIEYLEAGSKQGGYLWTTLGRIEHALGWTDGDFERILEGREPRCVETDPGLDRVQTLWPRLTPAQRDGVVAFIDSLLRRRR